VRAFRDPAVPHPSGAIDPPRDAQAMEDELILADLGVAERRLERLERSQENANGDLERERDVIVTCREALESGRPLRALDLKGEDLKRLRGFQFLSAKRCSSSSISTRRSWRRRRRGDENRSRSGSRRPRRIPLTRSDRRCRRLRQDRARDRATRRRRHGCVSGGSRPEGVGPRSHHPRSYDLLGYISFFTVGEDECRAWSIPRGTAAHLAAGEISQRHCRGSSARKSSATITSSGVARWRHAVSTARSGSRQGVHRPGRRHHQLPFCDLSVHQVIGSSGHRVIG